MDRRAIGAAMVASALLLAAAPAAAAEPFHLERLRAADVPVTQAEADVAWRSHEWGKPRVSPLPDGERARPEQDFGPLARPRWTDGHGNAAVVRIRNGMYPENHQANQWLRFLQAGDASPLTVACNKDAGEPRGVDAYLLEASHPDGPRYTYVESWLDGTTCKGLRLRGYTAFLTKIAGGAAYAYRTHCETCEAASRERLHVVIPTAQRSGATGEGARFRYWTYLIEHLEVPISVGAAATMTASIDAGSFRKWNRIVPAPVPVEDKEIRIEVTFPSGDAEPTIVVATRKANILSFD